VKDIVDELTHGEVKLSIGGSVHGPETGFFVILLGS
jgi:hypothetical protein